MSQLKELDADPRAIHQVEMVGQWKKLDNNDNVTDVCNNQSMFVLMILENIKETQLKFYNFYKFNKHN